MYYFYFDHVMRYKQLLEPFCFHTLFYIHKISKLKKVYLNFVKSCLTWAHFHVLRPGLLLLISPVFAESSISNPVFRPLHWKDQYPYVNVSKTQIGTILEMYVLFYLYFQHTNTALHYAAQSGLKSCVEMLVNHSCPLFIENEDNQTPCDSAEASNFNEIALYLESKMVFSVSFFVLTFCVYFWRIFTLVM